MPAKKKKTFKKKAVHKESAASIGNEAELWKMADAHRGSMDAGECKHVVLTLLIVKYISESFDVCRDELKVKLHADGIEGPQFESLPENREEYTAERVFWVPPEAHWARSPTQPLCGWHT